MYDATHLGFNYRLNEISCSIGIVQIKKLNKFLKIRKENYLNLHSYLKKCKNIVLPVKSIKNVKLSYYCFTILLNENIVKLLIENYNSY